MEELVIILIQFLIEVVGHAIVQIPFDCSWRVRETRESNSFAMGCLFLVVGGVVGFISVHLLPGTLIQAPALRLLNLLLSPLLGGTIAYFISRWQSTNRNPNIVPKYHFWYGFVFTLALACVRLAYGKR